MLSAFFFAFVLPSSQDFFDSVDRSIRSRFTEADRDDAIQERVAVNHAVLALAILGLTAWNLLFAAFLVVLEFRYLQPCPV